MSVYTEGYLVDYDTYRGVYVSGRKANKPLGPDAPHYPNKAERVLLTQMMQKSGQTEEQVRAVKSNRIKLAAASKSMSQSARPSWGAGSRREFEKKRELRIRARYYGVPVWELQQWRNGK